jgi:hypothetical protein
MRRVDSARDWMNLDPCNQYHNFLLVLILRTSTPEGRRGRLSKQVLILSCGIFDFFTVKTEAVGFSEILALIQ